MSELRFDGRVVVVTGAGRGVGRGHALLLASRGAKVVVADIGASLAGSGADRAPADEVVALIKERGGEAVSCFASVAEEAGAASIIEAALDTYGHLDAVINNAGISDKHPFDELTLDQFRLMVDVHYFGTLYVSKAAWPHLIASGAGRLVNTSSEAITGNMEQLSSYGAAKGAVLALTRNLAAEGIHHGLRVNAIAPRAYTRMAEEGKLAYEPGSEIWNQYEKVAEKLVPDLVSPIAAYLAHESCKVNGEFFASGGGAVQRIAYTMSEGILNPNLTIEDVVEQLDTIMDLSTATTLTVGSGIEIRT